MGSGGFHRLWLGATSSPRRVRLQSVAEPDRSSCVWRSPELISILPCVCWQCIVLLPGFSSEPCPVRHPLLSIYVAPLPVNYWLRLMLVAYMHAWRPAGPQQMVPWHQSPWRASPFACRWWLFPRGRYKCPIFSAPRRLGWCIIRWIFRGSCSGGNLEHSTADVWGKGRLRKCS